MIECNPNVGFGQPVLKGRRLTVNDIVTKFYYEDDAKTALDDYKITLEDAKEALEYCIKLKCKEERDLLHYCDGCVLRTISEGSTFNPDDYVEMTDEGSTITKSKDGSVFFFGTIKELEESEFGKVTWLIAEHVYKELFDKHGEQE